MVWMLMAVEVDG